MVRKLLDSKKFESYDQHLKELTELLKNMTDIHESEWTYEDEVPNVLKKLKVSSNTKITNTINIVKQFTTLFI